MGVKDVIFLPVFLVFITLVLAVLRKRYTTNLNRKYFWPAIILKFVGALSLGLIYQFYYSGGDTFNYYHESSIVYESFFDSPHKWFQLVTANGEYNPETVEYSGRMYWYHSSREYMVVRFASVFSLLSGNSYLLMAFWFALFSFSGLWAMFLAISEMYPKLTKEIAIAIFFLPSVFFWGSGLMKDTLCMGGLGWMFYGFYYGVVKREKIIMSILLVVVFSYLIINIKPYIFYAFMPAAGFWVFNQNAVKIKSRILKITIVLIILSGAIALMRISLNMDEIAEQSKVQADYIFSVSQKQGGSGYYLGKQDGTFLGMVKLFFPAVNVSLFQPYLYQVKNPVMLLSSLEATFFMLFTIYVVFKVGLVRFVKTIFSNPMINFCLVFSILFAFFVGVSSYNFGALVRYKIPLMPFYILAMYLIYSTHFGEEKKRKPNYFQDR